MLNKIKDLLCASALKNGQKFYKQTGCLHKNVNKNCIQALRLLEKEGCVNEKRPFNVYVLLNKFNNKIKAVKSLTRIYIRNILLKKKDMVLKLNNKKNSLKKIAQIKNVQAQSRNDVTVRLQKKIILVIFSIFSFCTSILTEGKIQEELSLIHISEPTRPY